MVVKLLLEFEIEPNSETIPFDTTAATNTLAKDIFDMIGASCDASPYGVGAGADGFAAQLNEVEVLEIDGKPVTV